MCFTLCLFKQVFTGHDDLINTIVCAYNHVFTASNDKTAICWNFDTGKPVVHLRGHTHNVNTITCSGIHDSENDRDDKDGDNDDEGYSNSRQIKNAVGKTNNGTVVDGERDISNLIKQMGPRECVYTGSADKTAKTWSTRSGKCLLTFRGHSGPITHVALSKDGHILYTTSLDTTVRSWFADSAKPQFVFEGHKSEVISLVVSLFSFVPIIRSCSRARNKMSFAVPVQYET